MASSHLPRGVAHGVPDEGVAQIMGDEHPVVVPGGGVSTTLASAPSAACGPLLLCCCCHQPTHPPPAPLPTEALCSTTDQAYL